MQKLQCRHAKPLSVMFCIKKTQQNNQEHKRLFSSMTLYIWKVYHVHISRSCWIAMYQKHSRSRTTEMTNFLSWNWWLDLLVHTALNKITCTTSMGKCVHRSLHPGVVNTAFMFFEPFLGVFVGPTTDLLRELLLLKYAVGVQGCFLI